MAQPYLFHRHHRRPGRVTTTVFDRIMYAAALIGPILTIPQVLLVWSSRQTQGVSLPTWTAYTIASGLWLVYGLVHRQKPLVFFQILLFVLDVGVVMGVLIYR